LVALFIASRKCRDQRRDHRKHDYFIPHKFSFIFIPKLQYSP
jgi:hypothetical protein